MHQKHEKTWQRLCFALSFFHALIQERQKYAQIGWNKLYEFTQEDLIVSLESAARVLESTSNVDEEQLIEHI
jgi:dynein heavy chain